MVKKIKVEPRKYKDHTFSEIECMIFLFAFFQVEFVGLHGTIQPHQFSRFHLLTQRSNFLPFNIYQGSLNNEAYIQFYGRIQDSPKKPSWLDVGEVYFYVREFKTGQEINVYIEFFPKPRHCSTKKVGKNKCL